MKKITNFFIKNINRTRALLIIFTLTIFASVYMASLAHYNKTSVGVIMQATTSIKKAPVLSVTYNPLASAGPTKENVVVTITADEPVQEISGWTRSSDKLTLTRTYSDNVSTTVSVLDLYNNAATATITISHIDKDAPTIKSSFLPATTTSKTVNITLEWSDNDIVTHYCISNVSTGCTDWTEISGYSATKTTLTTTYTLPSTEGKYTRYAYVKDRAGNVSAAKMDSTIFDTQDPTLTVERSDYNTLKWTASDNVALAGYKVTTTDTLPTSWDTANSLTTGTYEIDQTHGEYFVHVKDTYGHTVTKSIKAYKLTKSQGTGTTLTIRENDSTGTILGTTYVLTGTTIYVTASANTGYDSLVLTVGGTNFTSGNIKTITSATTVASSASVADTTAPEVSITVNSYNSFTWNASDNRAVTGYAVTTSSSTPTSGWTTTGTLTSGTYTTSTSSAYYVHVKDAAGNTSYASISVYKISKSQGSNTTIKIQANNKDGAILTAPIYALSGSNLYITPSKDTGYCASYTIGGTAFTGSITHTVSADKTISSSASLCVPTTPIITASDNIASGSWHTDAFTLSFSSTIASGSIDYSYSYAGVWHSGSTYHWSTNTYSHDFIVKACNSLSTTVCSTATYVIYSDVSCPTFTITDNGNNSFTWSVSVMPSGYAGTKVTTSSSTPTSWDPVTDGSAGGTYIVTSDAMHFIYVKTGAGKICSSSIWPFYS